MLLIQLFALGVSIIIGDMGWRRGHASFDDAWQDARHKGRDILFAALGFRSCLSIAQYAGTVVGSAIGISVCSRDRHVRLDLHDRRRRRSAAFQAARRSGVSIGACERAAGCSGLTAVALVLFFYAGDYIDHWVFGALGITSPMIGTDLGAVCKRSDRLHRNRHGEGLHRRLLHAPARCVPPVPRYAQS